MLVDNQRTGNIEARYSMQDSTQNFNKTWRLVGSTLGTDKCYDLSNNDRQTITENSPGRLTWQNTRIGKNWLATTFFTPPKKDSAPIQLQPETTNTTLNNLLPKSAKNIFLDYYDTANITGYDTIQGIFQMIRSEQLCISNENENRIEIWWNPEYLNELIDQANTANRKCN
jgi:hypothetical protein